MRRCRAKRLLRTRIAGGVALLGYAVLVIACADPDEPEGSDGATTPGTSTASTTDGDEVPSTSTSSSTTSTSTGTDSETGSPQDPFDVPFEPDLPAQPEDPGEQVFLERTVFDGAMERTYRAYLPGNYQTRTEPTRIVVGFHPAQSSGSGFEDMARLHERTGAEDAIVVYPDGDPGQNGNRAWNAGFCCSSADDVAFFDAIVDDLSSLTTIHDRIAITGYSSGAMMVYRLLCDRSDRIAAAVPFGAYLRHEDVSSAAACTWQDSVPVLHVHGIEDAQMDPGGQDDAYYPNSGIVTPPLPDYMETVAERNGGAAGRSWETFDPQLDSAVIHLGESTAYVLIDGLGHSWPGVPAFGQFGPGRTDLDGSEAVMEFLLDLQ